MTNITITPKQLNYLKKAQQDTRLSDLFVGIKDISLISKFQASKIIAAIKLKMEEPEFNDDIITAFIEQYTNSITFNTDKHITTIDLMMNDPESKENAEIKPFYNYNDIVNTYYPEYFDLFHQVQDHFQAFYNLFKVSKPNLYNTNLGHQMVLVLFINRILIHVFPTKLYKK